MGSPDQQFIIATTTSSQHFCKLKIHAWKKNFSKPKPKIDFSLIEITLFLQQPNLLLQGTETGRDSLQSTPPNSSSNNGEDTDEQPQPLNLTKRTDPYDQDFIDASSSHKNGE